MAIYAGLTDDPKTRREKHGNPPDWMQTPRFASEVEARAWEAEQHRRGAKGAGAGPVGDTDTGTRSRRPRAKTCDPRAAGERRG